MNRSGLASFQDMEALSFRHVSSLLEDEQAYFLSHEHLFRSSEYRWPRDSLHNWSRVWEYPYVFHHLGRMLESGTPAPRIVVDVGSGVTFFPFAIARRFAADIICTDIDSVAEQDLLKAAQSVPHSPGSIAFRRTDGSTLPFKDASVDAVYCISVLEHINGPDRLIGEIARILRAGAPFILTIDIALEGDGEIKPEAHNCLVQKLAEYFDYTAPDITVHPASLLTSENSQYPLFRSNGSYHMSQLLKAILGIERKKRPRLAVQGFALRKKPFTPCAS